MKKLIALLVVSMFLFGCSRYVKEDDAVQIAQQVYYQELKKAPTTNQTQQIARNESIKISEEYGNRYVTKEFYIVDQQKQYQTIKAAAFDIQVLKQPVYFTTAQYNLDGMARALLVKKAQILKAYPNVTLNIIGRASHIGSDSVNDRLALKRAVMVKMFLLSQQVPGTRISTTFKGSTNSTAHLAEDQVVDFTLSIVPNGDGHPIPPEGMGKVDQYIKIPCAPPCPPDTPGKSVPVIPKG